MNKKDCRTRKRINTAQSFIKPNLSLPNINYKTNKELNNTVDTRENSVPKSNMRVQYSHLKFTKTFLKNTKDIILERPLKKNDILKHRVHKIEVKIKLKKLHSKYVTSLITIKDKRIVTGGGDGSISICSIQLLFKKWKIDVHKEHAHNGTINSLCELNTNNRIMSGGFDKTVKIWTYTNNELNLIYILKEHNDVVWKVITLTNNRFASCSNGGTIRIYKDNKSYEEIIELYHSKYLCSIIQLNKKESLIAGSFSSFSVWNLMTYSKATHYVGFGPNLPNGIIELSNGHIAISDRSSIIIIDSDTYIVIKEIKLHNTSYSSICMLDEYSFIYVYAGFFYQIYIKNFSILSKLLICGIDGLSGIISIDKNCFAIQNTFSGISIVKPLYSEK